MTDDIEDKEDIVDAGCCCVCGRCYNGSEHFYAITVRVDIESDENVEHGHVYCKRHYRMIKKLMLEFKMDLHTAEGIFIGLWIRYNAPIWTFTEPPRALGRSANAFLDFLRGGRV